MKKLLLILLLFPITMTGQVKKWYNIDYDTNYRFVSFSVDPQNAIWGSDKNSPGLDFVAKIGANHGKVRVAMFYERFELIKYQSYGFQASYVMYPLRNVQALVGSEAGIINRMGPTTITYAFNGELEYHLERFFIGWKLDVKRRTDIEQKWGYSNYLTVGYKF